MPQLLNSIAIIHAILLFCNFYTVQVHSKGVAMTVRPNLMGPELVKCQLFYVIFAEVQLHKCPLYYFS